MNTKWKSEDISDQVFGRYVACTMYRGLWYADEDFTHAGGFGKPKFGAIPAPGKDRRPFRGDLVETWRRWRGAERDDG